MAVERLTLEEEEALVRRAIRGDGEAFGRIFDSTKNFLYSVVIFPRVGSAEAAEEVLQETYLLALRKLPGFEWRGKRIAAWLQSIAMNKILEWFAKRKKEPAGDDSFLDFTPDRSFQPEDTVILDDYRKELKGRIDEVLGRINERYKRAIELRLVRKRSREACAKELGVTVGTFDVVFLRACRAFRKAYKERFG
ncbi:MAG: sigma-70 family RNA polymerase sigma factor [bacterium]